MARLLWLIMLLGACASGALRPAADKLQPWTKALRDQQPEGAFAAVYKVRGERLVFLGAKHANRVESPTFRLIDQGFEQFDFDIVIAEGFATSRGANPPSILKYAAESGPDASGFAEGGETVPTVIGAQREGADLWGGEADDLAIKARLSTEGFEDADLLGFYVLRNIPQWIGERKISGAVDPRLESLVEPALAKSRVALQVPRAVLPDFAAWAAWYQRYNGKPIGPDFRTEEVGPLADGDFGNNRIAYAVSRARDRHLHELVIAHLNARRTTLAVFGASHLMIHRPALLRR